MDKKIYIAEYDQFMGWFKQKHPRLFGKYWSNIVVPVDSSGVGVNDINMDDHAYEELVNLVHWYYLNEKGFL